jgi:Bacterial protein of unknown function (DUF945)
MPKKYVGVVFVTCLLLLALLPFGIGIFIEKGYRYNLDSLARSMKLTLKPLEYHRHWLYSDVLLATPFPLADLSYHANQNNDLLIKQRIYHGPLVFYHNSNKSGFEISLAHIDSFLNPNIFLAQTSLRFNKDLVTYLSLDNYTYYQKNKLLYALQGLTGKIEVLGGKRIATVISLKHLTANFDHKREIQNFTTNHQLAKNDAEIWLGKNNYHFDHVAWQQEQAYYSFNNVNVVTYTLPQNKQILLGLEGEIGSARKDGVDYGVQRFSLNLAAKEGKELRAVQDYLITPSPDAVAEFQNELKALLNQGADLKINLLGNTVWGRFDLRANVAYSLQKPNEIASLLAGTQGKLQGRLPLLLANRLLTSYYQVFTNGETVMAQKKAENSILEWQKAKSLDILGSDIKLDLHWQ